MCLQQLDLLLLAEVGVMALVQSLELYDTAKALEGLNQLSLSDNDDPRSLSPTSRSTKVYKSPHQPNIAKHRSRRGRRRKVTYPNIPVLPVIGGIVLPSVTSLLAEHYRQQAIDSVSVAQSCASSIVGSMYEEEITLCSPSPPRSPTPFRNTLTSVVVATERAKQKHQKLASRRKSATAYDTGAVLSFMRLERNSRKPDFSKFWNASWGKGDGKAADDASLVSSIDGIISSDQIDDGNNQPQTPNRLKLPSGSQNNSQSSDSYSRYKSPTPSVSHNSQDAHQLVAVTPVTEDSILLLEKELADYLNNVKRAYPTKLQQRQERNQKIQKLQHHQQQKQKKQVSYFFGTGSSVDEDSIDGGGSLPLGGLLPGYRDDGDGSIYSLDSLLLPGYSNIGSLDGTEFSIIRSTSGGSNSGGGSSGKSKGFSRGNSSSSRGGLQR